MSESETLCANREGVLEERITESGQDNGKQVPRNYTPIISPGGRLVVTFDNGFQVGSIVDKDYFVEQWFKPYEVEIAARFEDSTQQNLKKLGPRNNSGLHQYSHTDRVAQAAFETAKQADVPLDFKFLLMAIGHDGAIEDYPSMRELYNKWELAVNIGDTEGRESISRELNRERVRLRGSIEDELLKYSSEITGIGWWERRSLENNIRTSAGLISDVTRFFEQRIYASSMDHQYHKVGREGLDDTLRRVIFKNSDRGRNINEIDSLFLSDVMIRIDMAFNDDSAYEGYVIGEELRRRFGDVRVKGVKMSNAVQVYNAFKSIFPLQYFNETRNDYGVDIESGKYGRRTKDLLKLAVLSTTRLIEDTKELAKSAFKSYEASDSSIRDRTKPEVDDRIERFREGTFYDRATLGGVIEYWLLNEQRGSKFIESLDRNSTERAQIYRTARHLFEMISRYGTFYDPNGDERRKLLDDPELYNPGKHRYFTLQNFDSLIKLMPDLWSLKSLETSRATLRTF